MTPQNNAIKIFLVDDHLVLRQGLVSLLADFHQIQIVGHAANGIEALFMIRSIDIDILITDLSMPEMDGYDLLQKLRIDFPHIKVIVLSMYYSDRNSAELITRGANGALPKECSAEELVEAIENVYRDGYYFNAGVSKHIIKETSKRKEKLLLNDLSKRELEILKLICQDFSNKKIASALNITLSTVEFHKKKIYQKTEADTNFGLFKYAVKNGLVSLE